MSTNDSKPSVALARTDSKTTNTESRVDTPPTTPTALSTSAYELFSEIRAIHQDLAALGDLAPGETVNELLTRLVRICIAPYETSFTDSFFNISGVEERCVSLRALCATAEGELEKFWASSILSASTIYSTSQETQEMLLSFPYHENYTDLSRLEASLLTAFLPTPGQPLSLAFIGSGPLPLTSIHLLSHFPTATIHNIDRDANALQQGRLLAKRLGYATRMSFACEDAGAGGESHWDDFDVVFLAALVGMTSEEKLGILRVLAGRLRAGCLVVCRSARGMRGVLYPILELSDELARMGYETLAEVHPWTSVVNSVVVLRVR